MLLAKSKMVVIHELSRHNNQGSLLFSWIALRSVNGLVLMKRVRQ
jgi:hypothetical protein